jgi:outer membrane protein TolC
MFRSLTVVGVSSVLALVAILPGTSQTSPETPNPGASTPTPVTPTNPAPVAAPANSAPTPAPGQAPIAPASDFSPNPNPLYRPTQPEEVRIQAVRPITLTQAQDLALQNDPQIVIARERVARNRAVLREAQASLLPTVNLEGTFTHRESFRLNPEDQTTSSSSFDSSDSSSSDFSTSSQQLSIDDIPTGSSDRTVNNILQGQAQLSYNVFTFGLRAAQIRAAERQIEVSQLDLERLQEETRLNVALAYYDLQNADELVQINGAAVTNARQSLQDTQAQERAGLGTRFDVLQSQVQLANSVQTLTDALSQQQTARRQLAQRLNLSQVVDLTAADPVQVAGTWDLTLEESLVRAFGNRVELQQQLTQREISEQQRRAALAAVKPQVGVGLNYSIGNDFSTDNSATTGFSIVGTVRWDIFDGGVARARARQFERDKAIAENQFTDARNQIRLGVEQSYFTLRSTFENVQTAGLSVQQAEEALRLARLRFQAGVGTQTDVINQETALTRARGNQVQAIVGYNRALAQLRRNVSRGSTLVLQPLPADPPTPPTPVDKATAPASRRSVAPTQSIPATPANPTLTPEATPSPAQPAPGTTEPQPIPTEPVQPSTPPPTLSPR